MEDPQSNLSKLKAFKTIQKHFAVVGISPKLATQSYPLNWKIIMGFLSLGLFTAFICIYTVGYAETFIEYTEAAYVTSLDVLIIFALAILILQVGQLFKFINLIDSALNMSK